MTTLGEALNQRSDLQKRIAQLNERLSANVLVQEGDQPAEPPEELLAELDRACGELELLITRINQTNAVTKLTSGGTVTAALARRDVLAMRTSAIRAAIKGATDRGGVFGRYSRSEIRMVRQVEVAALQMQVDALAKARRELDTKLQQHNWTTPLIE
ncbi:MAG: DIP1984 family protein [Conexibacteraceae bacterium]|nr:DIP1984 family protein [Conexibacteraceae bacterium]